MEAHTEETTITTKSSNNTSWSSASNWPISHGSLNTSITVESSDSPVDDSLTLDSTSKSPLVLKSSSSDSGPCEIKISFAQKHEIRQIYVRSTARVYEIYYAPDLRSNNEYLCTVRCSIADREEELLHATDIEEAVHTDLKGSKGELAEEKAMSGSNNGSSEDEWVEVKIPHSPALHNGNSSLPEKTGASTRSIQDFYEATAEISDADPCISLTLRLLSLHNKGCVFVDEVYVFADPVESSDSENQAAVQAGNSAGSSLMAMLAPTLLQLSKSGIGRLQEKQPSRTNEKREYQENGLKTTELSNTADRIPNDEKSNQQNVKLNIGQQEASVATDGERKFGYVAKNENTYSRFEGVLEQLVSRVGRIEDMFLRFEENMLKPITGIETRLQRVEQQLEVLSKNSQHSIFPSCTRFSAPAFSSMESYSSSYNEGTDFPSCRESELEKDTPSNKIPKSSDETSTPVIAPQFLPSLVVTAPEFSCGDDEEENTDSKSLKDSPLEISKKSLSIDDALAAALAGFSSITSVRPQESTVIPTVTAPQNTSEVNGDDELSKYTQPPTDTTPESTNRPSKYTQTLKVTAPEFTIEENSNDDKLASPSIKNSYFSDSCAANGNECICHSVSTSCVEDAKEVMKVVDDALFEETVEGVNRGYQVVEGCTDCSSMGTDIGSSSPRAEQVLTKDDHDRTEEIGEQESKSGPERDALAAVAKHSYTSVVDFETPILDVKFSSLENSSSKSSLEALLSDAGGIDDEGSDSLVVLGDGETETRNENQLLVDLECYDGEVVSDLAGEGLGDEVFTGDNKQEVFESLI